MGFASAYLEERALFPELVNEAPDKETGIIVVVPAYNEPGIGKLLDSLALCIKPQCEVEVIIIVNAPAGETDESIKGNRITLGAIETWKTNNRSYFFRLFTYVTESQIFKKWGVGLARKAGMDEAVRRFNIINKPDGVILSIDADCLVEKNYFEAVFNELLNRRERMACSVYFEHPLTGSDYPEINYKYITLYELHLRYYFQGLLFSGFPYVFHTVGSAIAVKALPYVKVGGMNRRQAGEDFYFIQKLVPLGSYFSLNSTTVYPSPRASFRVPFGTGTSIGNLSDNKLPSLLSYNILTFKELRLFFSMIEKFYHCNPGGLSECYKLLPPGLSLFIDEGEWKDKIAEIKSNTSGLSSFKKRFFGWFNMFRIVKYLNYVHIGLFEKLPVEFSALQLLEDTGSSFKSKEPVDLLRYYRLMEKSI